MDAHDVPTTALLQTLPLAHLQRQGAVSFEVARGARPFRGLVVWTGTAVRAYVNACPHWGVALNSHGGGLFDAGGERLHCDTHGAEFEPESGRCTSGPCVGASLSALPVQVDGAVVRIYAAPALGLGAGMATIRGTSGGEQT